MPTQTFSMRLPGDLKEAAIAEAARRHLNVTDLMVTGLRKEISGDQDEGARRAAARIARLEDEVAALDAALARCKEGRVASGGSDAKLAAELQKATAVNPATPSALTAASGYDRRTVTRKLAVLVARGDVIRPDKGDHYPAPGADIRQALRDITWTMEPRTGGGAGTPVPAHVVPVAAPVASRKGRNAATGEAGQLAGVRSRAAAKGASLVADSDLPRPEATAVFQEPGERKTAAPGHSATCKCGVCRPAKSGGK